MIEPSDVQRLIEDARMALLPASCSRPGQSDLVASSPAGGQLVVVQVDGTCDVEEHVHEYDEFCMVLMGCITTWIGEKEITCTAGDFLFEPAKIPHHAHIDGPYAAIDFFAGPRFHIDLKSRQVTSEK